MSTLIVPVATIDALIPHNNADTLELAHVLGWQLVVKKGQHTVGDKVIYFPPDSVLPQSLSDQIGITQYLDRGRIRCTRLRGEPSFGLAITPDDQSWEIGQNVAEHYGVTKWEPPLRSTGPARHGELPEDALPEHPLFPRYTTIENMRTYPRIFDGGEIVAITEKIHGTNCRVGIIEDEAMAGSHRLRRKPVTDNTTALYWFPFTLEPVQQLLTYLARAHRQVVLYGEIYGQGVQSLAYDCPNSLGFRAFDLLLDGKYLNVGDFYALCAQYGINRVPLLETGPFSLAWVKRLSEGLTTLLEGKAQAHMREGVVVKPLTERTSPTIGRVILKYVGDTYLLGKKTDFAEE